MRLETERFGTIEVEEDQIYEFKQGIPGFEQSIRFAVIDEEGAPFSYLQSIEEPELVFLIVDPFLFFQNYEFELSKKVTEELGSPEQGDVIVRCILTAGDSIESSSLNLVAPIVINAAKKLGKQMILTNTAYTTKHALVQAAESK